MKTFKAPDLIPGILYRVFGINGVSDNDVWADIEKGKRVYKIQYADGTVEEWHPDAHLTKFVLKA